MAIIIQDGEGKGKNAGVNEQNRLRTESITVSKDQDINEREGKVWSLPLENVSPDGADDYIFYIKNNGNNDIEVTDFRMSPGGTPTQLKISSVSGDPGGGSGITPISRTVGSSATLDATVEQGTNITGLSEEGTMFYMHCDVAERGYHLKSSSNIIIRKGKAIAISAETAATSITGTVTVFEKIE